VEPDDFRNLALAEMNAVHRLAYHLAPRGMDVDDLVQETYLRAFKSVHSFKANANGIRPWLFKILHNVLNTRLSQDTRQRETAEGLQHEPAHAPTDPDPYASNLANIDWDRVDERLKAAIQDLPLTNRTAFLMCAVEGLNYREIAEITEVPIGTVMSRLYRARVVLSARLAALAAERGMGKEKAAGNRGIGPPSEG